MDRSSSLLRALSEMSPLLYPFSSAFSRSAWDPLWPGLRGSRWTLTLLPCSVCSASLGPSLFMEAVESSQLAVLSLSCSTAPHQFPLALIHFSEPASSSGFPRWLSRILPLLTLSLPLKQISTIWPPPLETAGLLLSSTWFYLHHIFVFLSRLWALWPMCHFWPAFALHGTCLPLGWTPDNSLDECLSGTVSILSFILGSCFLFWVDS